MSSVLGESTFPGDATAAGSSSDTRPELASGTSTCARSRSRHRASTPSYTPPPPPPAAAAATPAAAPMPAHTADRERPTDTAAVVDGVRGTMEYQQAWDVELWRAIQVSKLRQQLQEQKKKALEGLAQFVKAREQQALASFELKERDLTRRGQRMAEEEKQMERRKWRLGEMEKDIRHMRQQLADARRRAEADAKAEVERAKEDTVHAVALQEQRLHAAEAQAKHAEERLRQAQRDYLTLSEEFNRFRTRELTAQPEKVSSVESRMRAEFVIEQKALQDRLERQHHEREQQLVKHARELEEENRRLTALATRRKEQLRRTADEVVQLKQLNGELQERLHQLNQSTEAVSSTKRRKSKASEQPLQPPSADAVALSSVAKEIERLRRERRAIVEGSAGALDEDSDVVRCLDERIGNMIKRLRAGGQSPPLVAV